MQTMFGILGSSALTGLLLSLPFMIMEVVNRREFHEGFPFMLFYVLWLNLFAFSLILLPIVRGKRTENHDMANRVPARGNPLLTRPRPAAIISVVLILSFAMIPWLDSLIGEPLQSLVSGPNPGRLYLPGQLITLVLFALPVAAGMIARGPIVGTLRAGGSLFAHPLHLIIVAFVLAALAIGWGGLIMDQWPCFIGVPNCD